MRTSPCMLLSAALAACAACATAPKIIKPDAQPAASAQAPDGTIHPFLPSVVSALQNECGPLVGEPVLGDRGDYGPNQIDPARWAFANITLTEETRDCFVRVLEKVGPKEEGYCEAEAVPVDNQTYVILHCDQQQAEGVPPDR